jgi:hypothetical protein
MHFSKTFARQIVGIGGIKCPCCAPQGVKGRRLLKRDLNKRARIALNQDQRIQENEIA